jgi:hypothetical protein
VASKKYVYVRMWQDTFNKFQERGRKISERMQDWTGKKPPIIKMPQLLDIHANATLDAPPEKMASLVYIKRVRRVKIK